MLGINSLRNTGRRMLFRVLTRLLMLSGFIAVMEEDTHMQLTGG